MNVPVEMFVVGIELTVFDEIELCPLEHTESSVLSVSFVEESFDRTFDTLEVALFLFRPQNMQSMHDVSEH